MTPAQTVQFKAAGVLNGQNIEWRRSRNFAARKGIRSTRELRDEAARMQSSLLDASSSPPLPLPAVMFYGTGRLWHESKVPKVQTIPGAMRWRRLGGYDDCFDPASSFESFSAWYGEKARDLRNPSLKIYGSDARPEQLLAAVRKAIKIVLGPTGWTEIDWEFPQPAEHGTLHGNGHLVVEHQDRGRLPLAWLSDGVRNMISLVGDLAHRCARLNPHFGENAAMLTPGILLIDELDLHLHPSWQQLVVELLERAFPAMQKIYTTHSPQVLSTVGRENIRMIAQAEDGTWSAEMPDEETKGVESSVTMNDVMGVNQVPPVPEAGWRNDYTALIENWLHETKEGLDLRRKLVDHYGIRHPIILDFDRLIRFQTFKRRKSPTQE